ncbi:hypothetical protein BDV96DRAFT_610607 [Lophiotrema nucula]|uniref:Myb-like domain-containing protein n=1 Tax=Lophiotrema nucula TaxID=690887 RepID=A0A6A5ZNC2_9PLEO|nr:hypothetical protein BDV96DRAFT_610607 [Lophiotrema nucula]
MSGPSQQPPYDVGYGPQSSSTRKRSRPEEHQLHAYSPLDQQDPYGQASGSVPAVHHTPQGYPLQTFQPAAAPHTDPPRHHHHRLPGPPETKRRNTGLGMEEPQSPLQQHGPPSMVGQEGMPPPAPRPRGPKLKFTPEDDQLLVDLKEKKNLTWKQIADFFPGRSSGTLQVRYCTKLKAKTTVWTDEMVLKLRNAMQEYENDRWRIISSKVGSGFSPAACRDKAEEIAALDAEEEEGEQSGYQQTQLAPSSSDQGASYQ